jgi:hypothetical protein
MEIKLMPIKVVPLRVDTLKQSLPPDDDLPFIASLLDDLLENLGRRALIR